MTDIQAQRDSLRTVLAGCASWWDGLPVEVFDKIERQDDQSQLTILEKLSNRAASSLLNAAMVGAYSSGKSFLAAGIQGALEYVQVRNEDGEFDDQFVGILHSAAKAAGACPAAIVPVEASPVDVGERLLRVRFGGSAEWVDIASDPSPEVIAAYTCEDQNLRLRGRKPEHRNLQVSQAELLLPNALLPVKLYDLPGFGSVYGVHDEIAIRAWGDADCFLYVTQATTTLSQADLDLLQKLYEHYLQSRKPVIWILAGIDRVTTRNLDNLPEWQDVLSTNNSYLREKFPPLDGHPDT